MGSAAGRAFRGRPRPFIASAFAAVLCSACGGDAGLDGSEILVPFDALAGGVLFATAAISGSNGYDLYRVALPAPADVAEQIPIPVIDASGDQWQPTVAANGSAIAFASESGIFLIANNGRVRQISDTLGTGFVDSLPALSATGDFVAWVRENEDAPIGGFFQSEIWLAKADGTEARALRSSAGVVQDAPTFSPSPQDRRIAWTEFAPESIVSGFGPTIYGIFIFDYTNNTGDYICRAENGQTPNTGHLPGRAAPYRCFGQHMAWPIAETVVLTQDHLEVSTVGAPLASTYDTLIAGVQSQQLGVPSIEPRGDGFYPAFPISASYVQTGSDFLYVFDGVVTDVAGDLTTLGFFLASGDGSNARRLNVAGLSADLDTINTGVFLFSRATPQIIPFQN